MFMQEHHDLADDLLVRPGRGDLRGPHRPDSLDLTQALGGGLNDVEDVLAEQLDHSFGVGGTDPTDHARAQILFDAFDRGGRRCLQKPRAELQAMRMIIGPFARRSHPFPGRDHRRMADGGDKIPMTARLDAKDAEAGLRAVECHPLDQPGQDFVALIRRRDESRWCFPHAPFFSALVHPAPVQRAFPVCSPVAATSVHLRGALHRSRANQRMRPMILISSAVPS